MKFFDKIVREDEALLRRYTYIADAIDSFAKPIAKLSNGQLKAKTKYFKELLKNGKTLDDILVEVYAVAREAAKRVRSEFPFYVQLIGAIILHNGDTAEMKTGEGKTLTSLLPIYLNALEEKGVHVVTTNEYLSKRDSETIGEVLKFLGISVGFSSADHNNTQKRHAYSQDVTYVANSEIGFDYLRDNMVRDINQKVQRGLHYAIVDECDSVLIDEARTPLIISGGNREYEQTYDIIDEFTAQLDINDYIIDAESKSINLSKKGQQKAEKYFKLDFLFVQENGELIHRIINSLRAHYIFEKGVEYIVKQGEIALVDQSTGRVMHGRSYSDGLHQAIEAKEHVKITDETAVVATITYQNYFRQYKKLAGCTGTAKTEEAELQKIYNMRVICVPTNLPLIRVDAPDYIFRNAKAKFKALLEEIEERHALKQPILIGTRSVEDSERVSALLDEIKIPHSVLNAKNNVLEAQIIEKAGQPSRITIATNMAGRGTDIKLGKGVPGNGGLCVLAVDRHESRRIDNQLRGRSGRQGDPGYSQFYLSLEDELIIRFGGDKLRGLFSSLGDTPLESKMVTKRLSYAQSKIEGMNFDSRKSLLEYDNILSEQREIMYKQRDLILGSDKILKIFLNMVQELVYNIAIDCYREDELSSSYDYNRLVYLIEGRFIPFGYLAASDIKDNADDAVWFITEKIYEAYLEKREEYDQTIVSNVERSIILSSFDQFWTGHIDNMIKLRSSIHLRSYGQKNPLQQYIQEASELFKKMKDAIATTVIQNLNNYKIDQDYIDKINAQTKLKQKVKIG